MINPAFTKNKALKNLEKGGINRLPSYFKQELPEQIVLEKVKLILDLNLHTVCQEAHCPNLNSCFKRNRLTFLILGDICTRHCRFCAVKKTNNNNLFLDLDEPYRINEAVKTLGLKFVVITSVSRDDLIDGGSGIFAKTVKLIKAFNQEIKIELLIPDFGGNLSSLKEILEAGPDIVGHNLETVKRLYKDLRPEADYALSLKILLKIKEFNPYILTKSSLMLGLGEKENEVYEAMQDLRKSKCDILTLGQYLAPSKQHYPVKEFISLKQFKRYKQMGLSLGFKEVLSAPKVRSSYQADKIYVSATNI